MKPKRINKPKGILMPIGGGEDSEQIFDRIIKETGKKRPKICYMTVATTSPKEAAQKHKKFFDDNFIIVPIITNEAEKRILEENYGSAALLSKYQGNRQGIPCWIIFDKDGNH